MAIKYGKALKFKSLKSGGTTLKPAKSRKASDAFAKAASKRVSVWAKNTKV